MRPAGSLLLCAAASTVHSSRGPVAKASRAHPSTTTKRAPINPIEMKRTTGTPRNVELWTTRCADVARYSIDESHKSTKLALRSALLDKTHAIWILQGRLFVHKAYLGEMKRELHLRFMNSVSEEEG